MKNYSHAPTDENVYRLLATDLLGRNQDIIQFLVLLSNMEDACYSIALNGAWGSGKTFFIKQAKLLLDVQNPYSQVSDKIRESVRQIIGSDALIPDSCVTVYYDAWINDNHDDPILSLLYSIINDNHDASLSGKDYSFSDTLAALASTLSGRDISALLQQLKGSDAFAPLKCAEDICSLVRELLDQLILERGNRLVVFIDELDRCKPDYTIRFLERIKHYFDDERVTFVFAVNLSQLQWTVKSYYGAEFDSTRYLDKFFDLRIPLRSVDYDLFLDKQLNIGRNYIPATVCIESAKYFRFSLREVERYGRMMKIANRAIQSQPGKNPDSNATAFAACYVVPIVLALQMYDIELYNRFMDGLEPDPMINILLRPGTDMRTDFLIFPGENYQPENFTIESSEGSVDIPLSDRLRDVYSALFSRRFGTGLREIRIGKMTFSDNTCRCVEEISSMLSPQSDYHFE